MSETDFPAQPQSNLQLTAATADIFIATLGETLNQNLMAKLLLNSWATETEIIYACYLKPLSLGSHLLYSKWQLVQEIKCLPIILANQPLSFMRHNDQEWFHHLRCKPSPAEE